MQSTTQCNSAIICIARKDIIAIYDSLMCAKS